MNWLAWLNGKKTTLGAILATVGYSAGLVTGDEIARIQQAIELLGQAGQLLISVGLVHKLLKRAWY